MARTRRIFTATAASTFRSPRAFPSASSSGWSWAACSPCRTLRGGGEYGREWHEAGMKQKKQNVFDDFIAAAEWLIEDHYTSREDWPSADAVTAACLVGACLTQRPDLVRRGAARRGRDGHAAVSQIHDRLGLVFANTARPIMPTISRTRGLFAAAQYQAGHDVSADVDYHRRSRRPRRAGHSFKFAAALQAAPEGAGPRF